MAITSGRDKVFKLIARGVELDLFQDETIYLSNNVTGLFDIGKLPSDFTRQLTIPGTKKNNEFFQHVYDISIDEPYLFKTNEKVIAQFDLDGFYVSQGYIQLDKVNLKENKYIESYEVSLYGLLSSFKKDLQNITLGEISELENYNHVFSAGCIANSWSGSSYTGLANSEWPGNSIFTSSVDGHNLGGEIVYCLNDGGKQLAYQSELPKNMFGIDNRTGALNTPEGGEIRPQNFKPAIRLDLVIDAIFDTLGYTYESTFLSESKFDNCFMLCDRGLTYPIINGVDLETYGQIEVGPVSGSSTPQTLVNGATQSLDFTNVYYDPSVSITDSLGTYTPFWGDSQVGASNSDAEITLNLKVTGTNTAYPELYFWRDTGDMGGYALDYINDVIRQDFLNGSGDKEYTLTQEIPNLVFYSGSAYTFGISYDTKGTGTVSVILGPEGNTESRFKVKTINQLGELSVIDIPSNMPYGTNGITCLDFIASIQKKFNLQIYPSKTKPRHFIIETFNNWYKQGKVKNFDKYMDLDKRISVTPANNLGVREVEFGDTLDLDYLAQNFNKENNREYGKSYFRDTQNFFSEGKLEVKSGFGTSPLRYVAGSGVEGSAVTRLTAFQGAVSNSISGVCTSGYTTFYSSDPIAPGVGDIVYYDSLGNNPVIGYFYFKHNLSSDYYVFNTFTGELISNPGSCSGGGGPTS